MVKRIIKTKTKTMEQDIRIIPGNRNRLARYIFSLKGYRILYAVLIALGIVMIPVIFAYFDGNFINPALKADILGDYANMAFYFIGFPAMLVTAILYAGKFPEVLQQLRDNEIINTSDADWNRFKTRANEIYAKWYYTSGPHLIALVVTVSLFFVFRNPRNPIWYSLETDEFVYLGGWAQLIVYYMTFYTFSLSLLNILATYRILKVLFAANRINVQPLHPDKCGGLAPLGALSRTLIYGIVFLGIIVALNVHFNYYQFGRELTNPLQISIMLGYLLMAYVIFFLPLHAAHKPMKRAKEEELKVIHHYIARFNKEIKKDFEEHRDIDAGALENFNNAREMYDITMQMPVYPYNVRTVVSFVSSVAVPVLLYFMQRFLDSV